VLSKVALFKSNWWFRPTGPLLSLSLWFLTCGVFKQVHAADAPPPASSSSDEEEYEDEYLPYAELTDQIWLDKIRLNLMSKLPQVEEASDSDMFEVASFLTNERCVGEAPTQLSPGNPSTTDPELTLLINRLYSTHCLASQALLGFSHDSLISR